MWRRTIRFKKSVHDRSKNKKAGFFKNPALSIFLNLIITPIQQFDFVTD